MKVVIFTPKEEFTREMQDELNEIGEIVYTKSRDEIPLEKLKEMCKDAEIIGFDPDNIGGFEKTPERLKELINSCPKLKGLALATTAFGYVDQELCKEKGIVVTNVPYYSTESVAEHALALLFNLAKRIMITDRRTREGKYKLEEGFELKGKTLGVIGLGHIGSRIAELGKAIGMNVIAYNRTEKDREGVEMKSLDEVLAESDALSINLAENEETKGLISEEKINKLKEGVIIANTADRAIVDEEALAVALKSRKVDSYALEAEDIESPPLGNLENAILIRGFGWFTKEALEENKRIWVDNIIGISKEKAINLIK